MLDPLDISRQSGGLSALVSVNTTLPQGMMVGMVPDRIARMTAGIITDIIVGRRGQNRLIILNRFSCQGRATADSRTSELGTPFTGFSPFG